MFTYTRRDRVYYRSAQVIGTVLIMKDHLVRRLPSRKPRPSDLVDLAIILLLIQPRKK